jgi:hypothetical protein
VERDSGQSGNAFSNRMGIQVVLVKMLNIVVKGIETRRRENFRLP